MMAQIESSDAWPYMAVMQIYKRMDVLLAV